MSTRTESPRPSSKTTAKRRAASRKRRREFWRRFLAIFFVFIFVLGTATTAFLFAGQTVGTTTDTPTAIPAAQLTPSEVASSTLEKKGDDAMAQNKFQDALSYYSAASALDQSNAQLHYKTGDLLIEVGKSNYNAAADQLVRATQLDPNGAVGTQAKTLIEQNKNKLPTPVAVVTATPIVSGTQTAPADLVKQGDDAVAQGKYSDAVGFYQQAESLGTTAPDLHYKMGSAYIHLGDTNFGGAADQLARAVQLDPTGSVGTQAKALMDQNSGILPTRVVGTGAPGVQGAVTSTAVATNAAVATSTPTPAK